jgi:hypothetical protein
MGGENATSENPLRQYYFLILLFNFPQNFYPPKPNYLIFEFFKIFPKNILTNGNLLARLGAWGGENAMSENFTGPDKNFCPKT